MKQATAVGGDMLIVAGAGAKEVAELVVAPTEALGGGEALEPADVSAAAFDGAVVLMVSPMANEISVPGRLLVLLALRNVSLPLHRLR